MPSKPIRPKEEWTMAEEAIANTAQREYWNTVAGPRWLGLQGFVERRVQAVNDLLLKYSGVKAGERVLEIGCGTGAFTAPLAEVVGASGAVVGADISAAMLAGARRRLAEGGLNQVSLVEADAQIHSFEPGQFDLIVSRFGVMFFADPGAAFTNLFTAVRPGGRLCFACWGRLEDNEHWLIPYRVALRHLGPPAPTPTRAPGPMAFADADYVREFLGRAGFADATIGREHPDIFASSPAEEAEHACLMGPSARLIDEKRPDEATRQTIRRDIEQAFTAGLGHGRAVLPSTVLLVTAHRAV
jgi:SAM-dependent methyltransferase